MYGCAAAQRHAALDYDITSRLLNNKLSRVKDIAMSKERITATQAVRTLRKHGAKFAVRTYRYEEKGGTQTASQALGIDEHCMIKTLVMEDENRNPFLVLMHGDQEVSTKNLARILGVKTVRPCDPDAAGKHTGYKVGGTSPFGTKKNLKVYLESTIANLPEICINAGKRGLLAEMSPEDLIRILDPMPVNVAVDVY